jgi:hypothetical protein
MYEEEPYSSAHPAGGAPGRWRCSRPPAALVIGSLVMILVLSWWWLATAQRVSSHNSRQVEPGMTRRQVEAVLGGPAGDYRTPPTRPPDETIRAALPPGDRW